MPTPFYRPAALEIGFGAGAGAAYLLGCNDNPDVAAVVKEAVKAKRIKSEITTDTQFAGHYLKPRP